MADNYCGDDIEATSTRSFKATCTHSVSTAIADSGRSPKSKAFRHMHDALKYASNSSKCSIESALSDPGEDKRFTPKSDSKSKWCMQDAMEDTSDGSKCSKEEETALPDPGDVQSETSFNSVCDTEVTEPVQAAAGDTGLQRSRAITDQDEWANLLLSTLFRPHAGWKDEDSSSDQEEIQQSERIPYMSHCKRVLLSLLPAGGEPRSSQSGIPRNVTRQGLLAANAAEAFLLGEGRHETSVPKKAPRNRALVRRARSSSI